LLIRLILGIILIIQNFESKHEDDEEKDFKVENFSNHRRSGTLPNRD